MLLLELELYQLKESEFKSKMMMEGYDFLLYL